MASDSFAGDLFLRLREAAESRSPNSFMWLRHIALISLPNRTWRLEEIETDGLIVARSYFGDDENFSALIDRELKQRGADDPLDQASQYRAATTCDSDDWIVAGRTRRQAMPVTIHDLAVVDHHVDSIERLIHRSLLLPRQKCHVLALRLVAESWRDCCRSDVEFPVILAGKILNFIVQLPLSPKIPVESRLSGGGYELSPAERKWVVAAHEMLNTRMRTLVLMVAYSRLPIRAIAEVIERKVALRKSGLGVRGHLRLAIGRVFRDS